MLDTELDEIKSGSAAGTAGIWKGVNVEQEVQTYLPTRSFASEV